MKRIKTTFAVLAILGVWSCSSLDPIEPGTVNTGSLSFARFHSVGNSLTAGFQSGGLVTGFQNVSYPAMIAAAAQASEFGMPLISENGIPATLYVSSFSPLTIDQLPTTGGPTNLNYPLIYNNLGIPGATLHELLVTRPQVADPNVFFDIVLRDSAFFGSTAVDQAANARPTVLTVWVGANDLLGSASVGTDLLLTPAGLFDTDYRMMMDRFVLAADAIIAANLPDVTELPFFTTIDPFILVAGNQVPLIGTSGLLTPTSLVTLAAAGSLAVGVGVPVILGGTGRPLPDFYVLTDAEQTGLDAGLDNYNASIDSICRIRGIPVANMLSLFEDVSDNGLHIRGEGNTYTTEYLSGGLFSVDGVHPSSVGYWVIAREFVRVMNANFGATIPEPLLPVGPLRDPGLGFSPNVIAGAASITLDEWRGLWMGLGVDESDMP